MSSIKNVNSTFRPLTHDQKPAALPPRKPWFIAFAAYALAFEFLKPTKASCFGNEALFPQFAFKNKDGTDYSAKVSMPKFSLGDFEDTFGKACELTDVKQITHQSSTQTQVFHLNSDGECLLLYREGFHRTEWKPFTKCMGEQFKNITYDPQITYEALQNALFQKYQYPCPPLDSTQIFLFFYQASPFYLLVNTPASPEYIRDAFYDCGVNKKVFPVDDQFAIPREYQVQNYPLVGSVTKENGSCFSLYATSPYPSDIKKARHLFACFSTNFWLFRGIILDPPKPQPPIEILPEVPIQIPTDTLSEAPTETPLDTLPEDPSEIPRVLPEAPLLTFQP